MKPCTRRRLTYEGILPRSNQKLMLGMTEEATSKLA